MKKFLLVLLTIFLLAISTGCSKNGTSSEGTEIPNNNGDYPADG